MQLLLHKSKQLPYKLLLSQNEMKDESFVAMCHKCYYLNRALQNRPQFHPAVVSDGGGGWQTVPATHHCNLKGSSSSIGSAPHSSWCVSLVLSSVTSTSVSKVCLHTIVKSIWHQNIKQNCSSIHLQYHQCSNCIQCNAMSIMHCMHSYSARILQLQYRRACLLFLMQSIFIKTPTTNSF